MEFPDDFIEPVSHGWVTDPKVVCHFFKTPAALNKMKNEGLIGGGKADKVGQGIVPRHLGFAVIAAKACH
ncbi:MAG: hypothetical protein P1U68_12960 [Verrucomicrobiales bacterium]|nr:hypothetical protein [Verrucomicrobiales bacterium]